MRRFNGLQRVFPKFQEKSLLYIRLTEHNLGGKTILFWIERQESLATFTEPHSPSIVLAIIPQLSIDSVVFRDILNQVFPHQPFRTDYLQNFINSGLVLLISEYAYAHIDTYCHSELFSGVWR